MHSNAPIKSFIYVYAGNTLFCGVAEQKHNAVETVGAP